jgi:hypothetical protein
VPHDVATAAATQPVATTSVYAVGLKKKKSQGGPPMGGIIYLVGLVVIVMFILSFLGLR